jgi:hypothetical protein
MAPPYTASKATAAASTTRLERQLNQSCLTSSANKSGDLRIIATGFAGACGLPFGDGSGMVGSPETAA